MDMNGLQIGAFCNYIGVKSAMLLVTNVNRMEKDQVTTDDAKLKKYEEILIKAMIAFVNKYIPDLKKSK